MSWAMQAALAAILFAAGGATGIKWHSGQDAIAARAAEELRQSDARQQRQFGDKAATSHATALAKINNQLGNAREKIASLSGRECFGADVAGVLNDTGSEPMRAAASEPAGPAPAAASGTGLRFTTDRDAAGYIALCRSRYAELSSQTNQILDIEDQRHPVQ